MWVWREINSWKEKWKIEIMKFRQSKAQMRIKNRLDKKVIDKIT